MPNLKGKLKNPFNYYYKSYSEWKCPFCGSDNLVYSGNGDLVFCSGYETGGYISQNSCDQYAHDRSGECDVCADSERFHKEEVKDDVYLCEDCHHGVNFTKMALVTDLFLHHNNVTCTHCQWHKDKISKH